MDRLIYMYVYKLNNIKNNTESDEEYIFPIKNCKINER
jgi:hypothetical protein